VRIVDLTDDAVILPVLERDRRWAAYALCDLEAPYRAHARFFGALDGDHARAVVLVYALPTATSLPTPRAGVAALPPPRRVPWHRRLCRTARVTWPSTWLRIIAPRSPSTTGWA
jgi:hypothetical protein